MAITEQDRAEWRGHPVTKELLSQLQASKQEVMEAWAGEGFVAQSIEQSAVQNAAATANPGVTSLTPSQWNWYLNQVTGIPGPGLSNYGLPTETLVIFSTYWTAVMLWAQAAAQSPTGNAGMLAGLSQQSTRTFDMQEAAW